ncbi:MAG TPA: asparagine synthase C-terminal domain-containing protein [Rhodanobacteraceae bacterium]|nr:asparagine synthase C-terminal domain-containing protein [Rhodanobacteraceae bacterium]
MIILERTAHAGPGEPGVPPAASPSDAAVTHLEFSGTRRPGNRYSIRYRLDERCAFVRGRGWWLYAASPTGLAIFTGLRELLSQAPAPALPLATVLEKLEDLRPVAFLAFDETTETLHFGRSLDGFASLFFGTAESRLVIADSRTAVAERLGPVRFSERDRQEWCAHFALHPEGSFYEGVQRCFAGTRYQIAAHEGAPRIACLLAADADAASYSDPVGLLTDGLRALFASYGNRKVALHLSGGVDSRTLLAGLMDAVREGILHRDQVLCTSVLFPGFDCDESDVIRPVVERSGFEWVGIEATRDNVRRAWEACLTLPAPPFPTSFMTALCRDAARQRGAEIMLTGHGGDELFDFNLADVLGLPLAGRLQRLDLIRYLRHPRNGREEAKALAVAVLGRRGQRQLCRSIKDYHLPASSLAALRISTRLALATGCGYETAAVAATGHGLMTDVPFFRGPFWSRLDPVAEARDRDYRYKYCARRYMQARAPDVAAVPTRKVAFDAAVAGLLQPPRANCDAVDSAAARVYAGGASYTGWREHHKVRDE